MPGQDHSTAVRKCVSCSRCFDPIIQLCPDCFIELVSLELIPHVINSRYRLDFVPGSGAFGTAFIAKDLKDGRDVLVKVVRAGVIADPQVQDRFFRETRLASQLSHPQIAALYDYGMLPDASMYLVLELVRGNSLRHEMRRVGKFTPAEVVAILSETAFALEIAHRAGLVHRDLRPECIALIPSTDAGQPQIKLFDFGLAVITGQNSSLDRPKDVKDSAGRSSSQPAYSSPGSLHGEEADPQSDIYSLGVIAYEMLTGSMPFKSPATSELRARQLRERPQPLRPGCPEIHPLLEAAIMKALEKESWQRQQTAAEFRRDLLRATKIG